jgi:hypothetical protein
MKTFLLIVILVLSAFTAISLACAVRISRRRPPAADPFFHPFGDMAGLTPEQLARIAAQIAATDEMSRRHLAQSAERQRAGEAGRGRRRREPVQSNSGALPPRRDADGGFSSIPSGFAAVRKFFARACRAIAPAKADRHA